MPSVRISTGIEEPNAATTTSANIFDGIEISASSEPARGRVEQPADDCGRKPEQQAGPAREQRRDQRDAHGVACAGKDAAEHVAAEIIGSERELPAHGLEHIGVQIAPGS